MLFYYLFIINSLFELFAFFVIFIKNDVTEKNSFYYKQTYKEKALSLVP